MLGDFFVRLGFEDKQFRQGINNAQEAVGRLGKAGRTISNVFGGVVTRGFDTATDALKDFAVQSGKIGAGFEQEIKTVGVISGAVGEEFKLLEDKARELGAVTTFSATESAEAMQHLARSGMSVNEILDATGPALYLAGAAGADMSLATETLAATITQFSLDASDAARVSDVFAEATRSSMFSLNSLREAMKYAGTAGAGFGMSLEETTAAISQFIDLGLEGSVAGTNFRRALASAAKGTRESAAALAKYGLTQADINPETTKFVDILEKLGKAGMTTTDSLKVFGVIAGANMATLARQYAQGISTYDELMTKFTIGGGVAEEMFRDMTNTVEGQFTIAKSALEELRLTVFDTFRDAAKQALQEVSRLFNRIALEVERSSASIGQGASDVFGGLSALLRGNARQISEAFVQIIQLGLQLTTFFVGLIPILDKVFIAMAAVFAVGKVISFVAALSELAIAVQTVHAAMVAMGAALSIGTGGMYALVVAIGAVVTALGYMALGMDTATAAMNKQMQADEEMRQKLADMRALEEAETETILDRTQKMVEQRQLELKANGQLTESYERQLKALQGATAQTIMSAKASGKIVEVNENGAKVYKTVAMLIEEIDNKQLQQSDSARQLAGVQGQLTNEYRHSKENLKEIRDAIDSYYTALKETDSVRVAEGALAKFGGTIQRAESRAELAKLKTDQLREEYLGLSKAVRKARHSFEEDDINARIESEADALKRQANALKAYERALAAATKRREKLQNEAFALYQKHTAREETLLRNQLVTRLSETRAAFDEEIKLLGENTAEAEDLAFQRDEALEQIKAASDAKAQQSTSHHLAKLLESYDEYVFTEKQLLEKKRSDELASLIQAFSNELELAKSTGADRAEILERENAALAELRDRHRTEDLQKEQERAVEFARILETIEGFNETSLSRVAQLHEQYQQALAQTDEDAFDERYQLLKAFNSAQKQLEFQQREDALAITNGKKHAIIQLEKEKQQALTDASLLSEKERDKIANVYDARLRRLRLTAKREFSEGPSPSGFVRFFDQVGKAGKKAFDGINSAIGMLERGFEKVKSGLNSAIGGLETLTGVSMDLMGAVSSVNDALIEQEELAAERGPYATDTMAANPGAAAAKAFVDEMISDAVRLMDTLIAAVPALVEAFFEQLPQLLERVGAAVPVLLQSIIDGLPLLMQAIAETVPDLINSVAKAIPEIVQAFVNELPGLIDQILKALPKLINGLAAGIVILVESLPGIIDAILQRLPAIITAVFSAIDDIILAVVNAIPGILQAVIDNLPAILIALVDGLVQVLITLVTKIPILIAAVISAIPDLLSAVLQAIPTIITNLVDSLPRLVRGLIKSFPILLAAVIRLIPDLIASLIENIPAIIEALIVELVPALIEASLKMAKEFTLSLLRFFRDVMIEIGGFIAHPFNKSKRPKTETFGDTPGVIQAGLEGLTANFAPGDYIAAARDPMDLLAQAVAQVGAHRLVPARVQPQAPMGPAAASPALTEGAMGSQGALQVTVNAEGRMLDQVLYVASRRGAAPRLTRMMQQATQAGAHIGVDRGRYSPAS